MAIEVEAAIGRAGAADGEQLAAGVDRDLAGERLDLGDHERPLPGGLLIGGDEPERLELRGGAGEQGLGGPDPGAQPSDPGATAP